MYNLMFKTILITILSANGVSAADLQQQQWNIPSQLPGGDSASLGEKCCPTLEGIKETLRGVQPCFNFFNGGQGGSPVFPGSGGQGQNPCPPAQTPFIGGQTQDNFPHPGGNPMPVPPMVNENSPCIPDPNLPGQTQDPCLENGNPGQMIPGQTQDPCLEGGNPGQMIPGQTQDPCLENGWPGQMMPGLPKDPCLEGGNPNQLPSFPGQMIPGQTQNPNIPAGGSNVPNDFLSGQTNNNCYDPTGGMDQIKKIGCLNCLKSASSCSHNYQTIGGMTFIVDRPIKVSKCGPEGQTIGFKCPPSSY